LGLRFRLRAREGENQTEKKEIACITASISREESEGGFLIDGIDRIEGGKDKESGFKGKRGSGKKAFFFF